METETVTQQQRLPQGVDDSLHVDLDISYTWWREDNPNGNIVDWLLGLPDFMYHRAAEDPNSASWLAWVAFWDWFRFQSRLLVAEAARKKEKAEADKRAAKILAKWGIH